MLKLTLIILVFTVAHVQTLGAWKPIDINGLPETVERVARWSISAMNQKIIESGSEGFHAQIVGVKDAFSQLVSGTNYRFLMDTIYSESNIYTVRFNFLVRLNFFK